MEEGGDQSQSRDSKYVDKLHKSLIAPNFPERQCLTAARSLNVKIRMLLKLNIRCGLYLSTIS